MDSTVSWSYLVPCMFPYINLTQSNKFIDHFIADSDVIYQELELNIPTVTKYVLYLVQPTWIYVQDGTYCAVQPFFFISCTNKLLSIPHQN